MPIDPAMRSGTLARRILLAMLVAALVVPAGASAVPLDISHFSTAVTENGGSGDGIISPGDSLSVVETLFSSDTVGDITNLNGTLTTSTPNVTLAQGSSP